MISTETSAIFSCTSSPSQPGSADCVLHITIAASTVDALFERALHTQKTTVAVPGFSRGQAPLSYIINYLRPLLIEHVTSFLFNYAIVNYLFQQIRTHQLIVCGSPRLKNVFVEPGKPAEFLIACTTAQPIIIPSWKHLPFKAPRRKNYRDLDKQVESFMNEEQSRNSTSRQTIQFQDWVFFTIAIAPDNGPACVLNPQNFWIHIGDEEADAPYHEIFLHKKVDDTFIATHQALRDFFSTVPASDDQFIVTVKKIISHDFFDFELFKHHFKLKSGPQLHQKLIEVFSYRNDLSQRRLMAQEALDLLLSRTAVNIPEEAIDIREHELRTELHANPDYPVYKMQKDFDRHVRALAHKQLREHAILDQLAYDERLLVDIDDISAYLMLTTRPRMREFAYFDIPMGKSHGQEAPIHGAIIERSCQREKALNYLIYHLTRR